MSDVAIEAFDDSVLLKSSVEMMREMAKDTAVQAASNLDEAYESLKKYTTIAKDEFAKLIDVMAPFVYDYDKEGEKCKLSDAELEMVVGGFSLWSAVCSVASKVKDFACDVWDSTPTWAKATIVGAAVIAVAGFTVGAATGVGLIASGFLAGSLADVGLTMTAGAAISCVASAAGTGALLGAGVGAVAGAGLGLVFS